MQLTDSHTHLYLEDFTSDRDLLIKEAIEKGVSRFFLPNIDSSSIESMTAFEKQYPENCFAMMGLHPCSVKANWKKELDLVKKKLLERKFAAVGEIGIDLYWDITFVNEQKEVFRRQIELANHYKLPVSIHSRSKGIYSEESFEVLYELLSETKKETPCGVFHCFTGNAEQAKKIIDMGFYLGIGGVITFKNSQVDKVINDIDLKYLVLETDAPYLAPVPFRGKRNLPVYILKVSEKIAEVKKITIEEVATATTDNTKKIFGF